VEVVYSKNCASQRFFWGLFSLVAVSVATRETRQTPLQRGPARAVGAVVFTKLWTSQMPAVDKFGVDDVRLILADGLFQSTERPSARSKATR
jgi:hypothetical protein